jgi:hypothetical protein
MPPSTIPSTSSAISSPARRFGSFDQKQRRNGAARPTRHDDSPRPPILTITPQLDSAAATARADGRPMIPSRSRKRDKLPRHCSHPNRKPVDPPIAPGSPPAKQSVRRPRILPIEPAGQSAGHVTDQYKSAPNIRRSPSRYLRGSTPGAFGGGARYGGRHAESKPLEREPGHIP